MITCAHEVSFAENHPLSSQNAEDKFVQGFACLVGPVDQMPCASKVGHHAAKGVSLNFFGGGGEQSWTPRQMV